MNLPARIAFVFAVLVAALLLLSAAVPARAQEPVPAAVFQAGEPGAAVALAEGDLAGQRGPERYYGRSAAERQGDAVALTRRHGDRLYERWKLSTGDLPSPSPIGPSPPLLGASAAAALQLQRPSSTMVMPTASP